MGKIIVFVGILSAILMSTEAQSCGAEEQAVVNKGGGCDGAAVGNESYEPTCAPGEPGDEWYQTLSVYNTCDGDKPADKDKDKGEGNIICVSVTEAEAVCKAGKENKSEGAQVSFWEGIPYGVCEPGAGQSTSVSAGG